MACGSVFWPALWRGGAQTAPSLPGQLGPPPPPLEVLHSRPARAPWLCRRPCPFQSDGGGGHVLLLWPVKWQLCPWAGERRPCVLPEQQAWGRCPPECCRGLGASLRRRLCLRWARIPVETRVSVLPDDKLPSQQSGREWAAWAGLRAPAPRGVHTPLAESSLPFQSPPCPTGLLSPWKGVWDPTPALG